MTVPREDLSATLKRYLAAHPDRADEVLPLAEALDGGLDGGLDPVWRKTFPLHVTCGGVAVNRDGNVLMIQYRVDEGWRLPGGHVLSTDRTLYDAAMRGLEEGTGVPWRDIAIPPDISLSDVVPVDIAIVEVPANAALREPAHLHADFRYVFHEKKSRFCLEPVEVMAFDWFPPVEQPLIRWLEPQQF
ncbi:NUDIX domain-containing protein [Nonomuraea rhizosphaerae]|uniref:NUDIX domain-containing protein n=1 Tax=Nonomuraea rhizosphaerae TaxID=2665663 RepID=UPI001C5CE07A|nr:NUDIX domain-containing protein [Nonomuraea rhizosphaerae]